MRRFRFGTGALPTVVAAGAILLVAPRTARADDIATMRQRAMDAETGGTSTTAETTSAQNGIVSNATSYLGSIQSDGHWTDIDYTSLVASATWGPSTHFSRLHTMARAYNIAGQSLYHASNLATAIGNGIGYATGSKGFYCGAACATQGNWWFWEIGAPLDFAPTLLLAEGVIDGTVWSTGVAALVYYVGPTPQGPPPHVSGAPTNTGQNLVWNAFNEFYVGLMQSDATLLTSVQSAIEAVCTFVTNGGDGIEVDDSFHQHSAKIVSDAGAGDGGLRYAGQLYTGGYGGDLAADVAEYFTFADGTSYAASSASFDAFAAYIGIGSAFTLMGNEYDVSVIGREVTRASERASNGLDALLRMSLVSSAEQSAIASTAKQLIGVWSSVPGSYYSIDVAPLVSMVEARPETAAWPSGHIHFQSSDHAVHRRSNYYASVKMLSTRMLSGELVNEEGKTQSRQSDGRLYLVMSGYEYFTNNVWPTLDWSRLPGTTVEQTGHAADSHYGTGSKTFVGGTGDGKNGVAAMDFAPTASSGSVLTAKKAYFFFDDSVVFATSGVDCASANPVETIVEQWPMSSPTAPIVVDGATEATGATDAGVNWTKVLAAPTYAFADGLGYFFFDAPSITANLKAQTGAWSDLGVGDSTSRSNVFLTLLYAHGATVSGASAAYAIVPATTATAMSAWAGKKPIALLQNDAILAAAKDTRSNELGVVFWQPGTVGELSSDTPAVAFLHDEGATLTLAAADPSQGTGSFNVTLSETLTATSMDPGVKVTLGTSTTEVSFPQAGGVTRHVVLARKTVDGGGPPSDGGAGHRDAEANPDGSSSHGATPNTPSSSGCACDFIGSPAQSLGAMGTLAFALGGLFRRRRGPRR
jgi:Polysaccharide lyase family 8, super-sandwich domain/Polysaccharide lyase family 8, N terminal alpha-helical domain/Polysaccharide lyase family 8, C-terminal beta-sandwich domain